MLPMMERGYCKVNSKTIELTIRFFNKFLFCFLQKYPHEIYMKLCSLL